MSTGQAPSAGFRAQICAGLFSSTHHSGITQSLAIQGSRVSQETLEGMVETRKG